MQNTFKKEKLNQNSTNLEFFIKEIFIKTNEDVKNEITSSVRFSGSTCISVIYTDKKLICANIGDSRAVMGRCTDKGKKIFSFLTFLIEWICYELSIDHKPKDPNEAKRIIKAGGRVEPFKDESGNSIGPSRIWLKDEMVPGLAMTRSFGDVCASEVGVTSEPGMFVFLL